MCNHNLPKGAHPCKNCTKIRANKDKDISLLENKLKELFGECNYEFPNPKNFNGIYSKKPFLVVCKKCKSEIFTLPNNLLHPDTGKHY